MKSLILIFISLWMTGAFGSTLVRVYKEDGAGDILEDPISIEKPKLYSKLLAPEPDDWLEARRPDQSNPLSLYTGVLLKDILRLSHADLFKDKVTIVGGDLYTVSLPLELVRNNPVLVALQKNQSPIRQGHGLPHIVFPVLNSNLPNMYQDPSWWVWWVSFVVVGNLPPVFEIKGLENKATLHLGKQSFQSCRQKILALRSYPSGKRIEKQPLRSIIEQRVCRLSDLLEENGFDPQENWLVEDRNGKKTAMSHPEKKLVVWSWQNQHIPSEFGGPIHLCNDDLTQECLHHVKGVSLEENSDQTE